MLSALHQYANAHMANKAVLTQRSQQPGTVAFAKEAENPLAKFGKQLTGVLRGASSLAEMCRLPHLVCFPSQIRHARRNCILFHLQLLAVESPFSSRLSLSDVSDCMAGF